MGRHQKTQMDLFEDRPCRGGTAAEGCSPTDAPERDCSRSSQELDRYLAARVRSQRQNEKRIEKLALRPANEGAPGGRGDKPPGAFAHAPEGG